MRAATKLGSEVPLTAACKALAVSRATVYRHRAQPVKPPLPRPRPARALKPEEEQTVLAVLHSERFVDCAPAPIVATLLDEGIYHCSVRTMYRLLAKHGELNDRRNQVSRSAYAAPELIAVAPNQVWSWDITKLRGPVRWTYYYLYVVMDIYSRYIVGWMVAYRESALLAKLLITECCAKQEIQPGQLTLHADRGSSMTSKSVALLLSDLGVTKSHSRPYVSDDNPFSESQFKTLKSRPEFPDRFSCIEAARAFCVPFFRWYATEHRHSGIGMLTPEDVHYGRGPERLASRAAVLEAAYADHPERFVRRPPRPGSLPSAVWINPPKRPVAPETGHLAPEQTS